MEIIHNTFHNDDLGVNILRIKDADGNSLFECRDPASVLNYERPKGAIKEYIHLKDKVNYRGSKSLPSLSCSSIYLIHQ